MKRLTYILLPLSMSLLTPSLFAVDEPIQSHCPDPSSIHWIEDSGTPGQWVLLAGPTLDPMQYIGNIASNQDSEPAPLSQTNTSFKKVNITQNSAVNIAPLVCTYTTDNDAVPSHRVKLVRIALMGMVEKYTPNENTFIPSEGVYGNKTCGEDNGQTIGSCTWTVSKKFPGPVPPVQS